MIGQVTERTKEADMNSDHVVETGRQRNRHAKEPTALEKKNAFSSHTELPDKRQADLNVCNPKLD